jgi:SnoaL-like domain
VDAPSPGTGLLTALFAGDAGRVVALFDSDPVVDAPRAERAEGATNVQRLATAWPALYEGAALRELRTIAQTAQDDRLVTELHAVLAGRAGELLLPVAVVCVAGEDRRLREARIYHPERLVSGRRGRRRPPFQPPPAEAAGRAGELPDVNAAYFRAVSGGDVDAVMELFAPGAYLAAPSRRVTRRAEIRAIYEAMAERGGLRLAFNARTDDGRTFVLEFTSLRESPTGGLAAYERHESGKIAGIRMYDEFDPDELLGQTTPR